MAKKPAERPQPANLSVQQMLEALPKLERRIADVEAFEPAEIREIGAPAAKQLTDKLGDFLASTYPPGTMEYNRYYVRLTQLYAGGGVVVGRLHQHEIVQNYTKGKESALAALVSIKAIMEEALADAGEGADAATRAIRAYEGLELHPKIARACSALYRDGHYAEAIEKAVKVLNKQVRLMSEIELDGSKLMEQAFGGKTPKLRFNELAGDSDRDEQIGYMMLFKGAVSGLRNPRAHRLMEDDPERALEFIAFVSLLAKLLDEAEED